MNKKKIVIIAIVCLSIIICISMFLILKSKTKQDELSSAKEATTEANIPSMQNNENLNEKNGEEISQGEIKESTTKEKAKTKNATNNSEATSEEESNEDDESSTYTNPRPHTNDDNTSKQIKEPDTNKSQSNDKGIDEGGIY